MVKQINQDIDAIKDDFFKGLTLRECIYGGIAFVFGVGLIIGLIYGAGVDSSIAIFFGIPIIAVIGLCGFYTLNGMTLVEMIKKKLHIIFSKPLTYHTMNPNEKEEVSKIGYLFRKEPDANRNSVNIMEEQDDGR